MTSKPKPIGMLIMILALVLVAVILVVVIVASTGGDDDTSAITTTQVPASSALESSSAPDSSSEAPDSGSTPESSSTEKPIEPIKPTLTETTLKADESGKVQIPSVQAGTGLLIDVSETNPYKYDLENIFKGDNTTTPDVIEKSDFKQLNSDNALFVTPGLTHYVRKEAHAALLSMITRFNALLGKDKAIQISGYTAKRSDAVTNTIITGNVITILGYNGQGTLGLNSTLNGKITYDDVTTTFNKWFEKYAQSYGFVYEGLVGDNVDLLSGKLRYVGSIHSAGVTTAGSLSAYLAGIKGGTITTATAADGSTWNLTYVTASTEENTEITVGANATYTVSGDNMGGFIVAVLAK